jgi:nucleotide-binding universal stress UspA family protein
MNRTILVPLDGSPLAEQGLSAACRIARATRAGLLLLTAVPISALAGAAQREKERAALYDAHQYLRYQHQAVVAEGLCVRSQVLPGDAAKAILFAAEDQKVQLISMATHGGSGLRQALLGSVASAVVRGSDTPILLSRARRRPGRTPMTPFRRIVVPLDGTQFAERALAYLQIQGLNVDSEVLLVRVVTSAQPFSASMLIPPGEADALSQQAESVTEQRRLEAEAYLRAVADDRLPGTNCRPVVVVDSPAVAIARTVTNAGADLIVMATHDHHGLNRLLYGSVARQVLRRAETPLLLLHGTTRSVSEQAEAAAFEAWTQPHDQVGEPTSQSPVEQPVTAAVV